MQCWKCGSALENMPKVSFRAQCDSCTSWLHVCKNCSNYRPGLPNDCMIPGTEYISDREACNFCEEFVPLGKAPEKKASTNPFNNLFKD